MSVRVVHLLEVIDVEHHDGQGLVRVPQVGPLELNDDFDRDLLRYIWVLKLAEEEADVIGDIRSLGVREVVVTLDHPLPTSDARRP